MAVYNVGQLQQILRRNGWPENLLVIMAAIGMAESSGKSDALNATGERSIGLWQINRAAHGNRFGSEAQLKDPDTNARAALTLYSERQRQFPNGLTFLGKRYTGANVGLTHWGAFTDGRYQRFMAGSQAAYGGRAPLPAPTTATPVLDTIATRPRRVNAPDDDDESGFWDKLSDDAKNDLATATVILLIIWAIT